MLKNLLFKIFKGPWGPYISPVDSDGEAVGAIVAWRVEGAGGDLPTVTIKFEILKGDLIGDLNDIPPEYHVEGHEMDLGLHMKEEKRRRIEVLRKEPSAVRWEILGHDDSNHGMDFNRLCVDRGLWLEARVSKLEEGEAGDWLHERGKRFEAEDLVKGLREELYTLKGEGR